MTDCIEEGVNVIVPCFGAPSHFEVEYHSKPAITPLVILYERRNSSIKIGWISLKESAIDDP